MSMHGLSVVLGQLGPVLPILSRIVEMLALLAAIRLGGRLLGSGVGLGARLMGIGGGAAGGGGMVGAAEGFVAGRALAGGARGAGAAEELAAAPGAAKTGMMAQILDPKYAVGGLLATAKMGVMKIASHGLTAMIVSSIADSAIDAFTTEGSNINSIAKNAVEGAAIGSFWGLPGAIIGALVDVTVVTSTQ